MKKTFLFLAVIVSVILTSCTKSETPIKNEPIKLNLKIEAFNPDTKVAKKDWATGDKINIWFDNSDFNHSAPDLVITYNGSSWTAGALRDGASPITSGGLMYFLYEGYNDLSLYNFSFVYPDAHYSKGQRLISGSSPSKYSYCTPLVVRGSESGVSYTFSSNTLTANLSGWGFWTQFKVLVKGLTPSNANKYQLQVHNTSKNTYPSLCWEFYVDDMGMSFGFLNNNGWAGGVPESDGVAFYYYSFSASSANITFTLNEFNDLDALVSTKSYSVTGKTVSTNNTKCVGIALTYANFE